MTVRRILTDLELTKIAGVDSPCQEGASVDIMKRFEPTPVPIANEALQKVMDVAMESGRLNSTDCVTFLDGLADEYRKSTGVSREAAALATVAATVAALGKVSERHRRKAAHIKDQAQVAADLAATQRDKIKGDEEDPEVTREDVLKAAAEVRKVYPHLSALEARERVYALNPGLRKALVEATTGREYDASGRGGKLAKVEMTSAQIEVAAKAAEMMQDNPNLSEHQARARVYAADQGLYKRLRAERSGRAG